MKLWGKSKEYHSSNSKLDRGVYGYLVGQKSIKLKWFAATYLKKSYEKKRSWHNVKTSKSAANVHAKVP